MPVSAVACLHATPAVSGCYRRLERTANNRKVRGSSPRGAMWCTRCPHTHRHKARRPTHMHDPLHQDSLAEWSKALAPGASPQAHGFEPHSCHAPTIVPPAPRFPLSSMPSLSMATARMAEAHMYPSRSSLFQRGFLQQGRGRAGWAEDLHRNNYMERGGAE